MSRAPYLRPLIPGRITIEGCLSNLELSGSGELIEDSELILGQGFCREEVKGTAALFFEECIEYRQIVAEGLAAG